MDSASGADLRRSVLTCVASLALVVALDAASPPILVAMAAVFVIAALASFDPAGGLCAVLVSLPWFFHPVAFGGQEFAASELLLFASSIGIAVATIRVAFGTSTPIPKLIDVAAVVLRQPLVWIALLLTVVGLLLALRPYDVTHRADSLREWRWTLLEPLILLVLLAIVCHVRPDVTRYLAGALVLGAAAAALYAVSDLFVGGGVEVEGVTRIAGPYPHPNALALYGTRTAALALGWCVFDPRVRRWLFGPATLIGLAVVATFSRGALIALAISSALLLPFIERRLRNAAVAVTMLCVIALVVVERDRMLDLFGGGSASLRVDIWQSAARMIRDRPILGYGPDQFLYAYVPRYIEPTAWNERFTAHAHNLILDFWIRLGIIGGAFAIGAIVAGAVRAHHVVFRRQSSGADALTGAGSVALVAALAHGLVDNAYFSHDLAMSGWFIAWLAFATEAIRLEGSTSSARPRRWRSRFHRFTPVRKSPV